MKHALFPALLLASATAAAQAPPIPSSGDYLQDFDRLITEIRGVRWSSEFCEGTFPEKKAAIDAAYAEWRATHAKLIVEMDGQFDVLDAYVKKLPENERGPVKVSDYKWEVESRRDSIRQHFLEMGFTRFAAVCDGLPELLRSPKFDFEVSRAALLENIRKGPQPLALTQPLPLSPVPSSRKEPSRY
jgi:hypothetical protein